MEGWRRSLFIALFPLNLCGMFLAMAAGHLPPHARISPAMARLAGLLLLAPMAILLTLTMPWSTPEADEDEGEGEDEPREDDATA